MTMTAPTWLLPDKFTLAIHFNSDWHVGTGQGQPGGVDRLVARDADGFPHVPAKTIKGIWRDSCEQVAFGMDAGNPNGPWSRCVEWLFGSQPALVGADPTRTPSQGHVFPENARFSSALRDGLSGDTSEAAALRAALTFVKPGVKIDNKTGRAADDHLRFEEVARAGAWLYAPVELSPIHDAAKPAAHALLVAGIRLVERLGANRRRGMGKCEWSLLESVDWDAVWAWMESHPAPELPKSDAKTKEDTPTIIGDRSGGDDPFWRIELSLTLETPLVAANRTVGNVTESHDFIPGTLMLGPITQRLRRRLGLSDVLKSVVAGDLQVLPATIEIDGTRGRPVPFAICKKNKRAQGLPTPENRAGGDVENGLTNPEAKGKPYKSGYVSATVQSHLPILAQVETVLGTHNTIDDRFQRPTEEVGGVYSYQALAPEPGRWRTELRLRKSIADHLASHDPQWWKRLEGACRLGRSIGDDYGRANLAVEREPEPLPIGEEGSRNEFSVWVVSDVLLRDDRLRFDPTIKALAKAIGHELGVSVHAEGAVMARQRRIESWHVGWGLPRPSLVTLAAGSCARLKFGSPVTIRELRALEAKGIGERRAEGFGQVLFGDLLLESNLADWSVAPEPHTKSASLNSGHGAVEPLAEADREFAKIIEREALRSHILDRAQIQAADSEWRKTVIGIRVDGRRSCPPMSQLGGLRAVLARLQRSSDRNQVIAWLDHLSSTSNRSDKWPGGALDLVRRMVDDEVCVWDLLDISPPSWAIASKNSGLAVELWPEAVRVVIDACIRAHKRLLDFNV